MSTDINSEFAKLGLNSEIEFAAKADPIHNPLDIFRSYIATELSKISEIPVDTLFGSLDLSANAQNGDLVIPVPRLGKVLKGKPADLAKSWADEFPKSFVQATASNIFLQFTFPPTILKSYLIPTILRQHDKYGTFETHKGKKVIVEFSSPNIAKPFHAGHLRSTILGSFLANIHEAMGWDVIRMNYLGDWGKQYGLLALGYEAYGNEAELEKDPIKHLYDVYVKVNSIATSELEEQKRLEEGAQKNGTEYQAVETLHDRARSYFKRMEDGEEAELSVWRKFRDLSIEKLKHTYERLNIKYDVYSGESQVPQAKMNEAINLLKEKNLLKVDGGAQLIDLTPYNKKLGKAIVQKKDGTTLYLTRDIGEAADRYEKYKFDKMIYVVAAQQDLHLAQLFKILNLMGYEWAEKCTHVNFGMVLGMSTRRGTAVFLDQILEEAKASMHAVMSKNEAKYAQIENPEYCADVVGITAVMIQDMSAKRINNYEFVWDRMTSFEGDTGPYMQYAHSRLCSMQRRSGISDEDCLEADLSLLTEDAAAEMIRLIATWPQVVLTTFKNQEACTIVTFLYRLCHSISGAYDNLWVINQEPELAKARMALYVSCRIVLHNGMLMLGLRPLDRM